MTGVTEPTEPGYYRCRFRQEQIWITVIVGEDYKGWVRAKLIGSQILWPLSEFTDWSGPIKEEQP